MRRLVPRPRGRATRRQYILLVALLALSGVTLAVLLTAVVTRADPSATSTAFRGTQVPAGRTAPAENEAPTAAPNDGIENPAVQTDAPGSGAGDTALPQGYGWLYHREYPLDDSGEQIAFGITLNADGTAAIQALGLLWNKAAGLDVRFEIPEGLVELLPLDSGQLSGRGLTALQTTRVPATFIDRSNGRSSTHAGTVAIEMEGAGDVYDYSTIGDRFSPAGGSWTASFAATADQWRLALVSISLDCPDLNIFQLVASDWETDFAELFQGSPLFVEIVYEPGSLAQRSVYPGYPFSASPAPSRTDS